MRKKTVNVCFHEACRMIICLGDDNQHADANAKRDSDEGGREDGRSKKMATVGKNNERNEKSALSFFPSLSLGVHVCWRRYAIP